MNFTEELKRKQDFINIELEKLMTVKNTPDKIIDAMKYSLFAGGKRIRPVLLLSVCRAQGGDIEDAVPFACSMELIHTYSLIHDDLPAMDNDDLRRGKPTNHKVFGDAIAVLAGDGLLNYAYEVMLDAVIQRNYNPKYTDALNVIAKAAGICGMVGGQVIDIESSGKTISDETLKLMHSKKTGALINAACAAGCIIAGSKNNLSIVNEYSSNLGIAFQIVDDILDYTGDVKKLGKNIKCDDKNDKQTYVTMFGIEKSKELALKYSDNAKNKAVQIDKTGFLLSLTEYLLNRQS